MFRKFKRKDEFQQVCKIVRRLYKRGKRKLRLNDEKPKISDGNNSSKSIAKQRIDAILKKSPEMKEKKDSASKLYEHHLATRIQGLKYSDECLEEESDDEELFPQEGSDEVHKYLVKTNDQVIYQLHGIWLMALFGVMLYNLDDQRQKRFHCRIRKIFGHMNADMENIRKKFYEAVKVNAQTGNYDIRFPNIFAKVAALGFDWAVYYHLVGIASLSLLYRIRLNRLLRLRLEYDFVPIVCSLVWLCKDYFLQPFGYQSLGQLLTGTEIVSLRGSQYLNFQIFQNNLMLLYLFVTINVVFKTLPKLKSVKTMSAVLCILPFLLISSTLITQFWYGSSLNEDLADIQTIRTKDIESIINRPTTESGSSDEDDSSDEPPSRPQDFSHLLNQKQQDLL